MGALDGVEAVECDRDAFRRLNACNADKQKAGDPTGSPAFFGHVRSSSSLFIFRAIANKSDSLSDLLG
jgi:hypothetical protein